MKGGIAAYGILTDGALRERILQGDVALFEILIRRYNPVLYKIARSYDFNHHDAEDLMQETHLAAYQHLQQFEGRASYKTWLSRIMVNKCLYQLRHGPQQRESLVAHIQEPQETPMKPQPEEAYHNKQLAEALERSLQKIPVLYRAVFVLRELEGFTVAETAGLLGISNVNVKVRLNRAKALLQKELESSYSRADLYSFNQVYCDAIVQRVFARLGRT